MLSLKTPEQCVPAGHPIRQIKAAGGGALGSIEPVLNEMYSTLGRPSIQPARLLKDCRRSRFRIFVTHELFNWDPGSAR
jgi:hypothetical protein